MIKVDNSEVKDLFKKLQKNSKKIYSEAIKGYTEKLAFETKKKAEWTIKTRFRWKNSATLKRSQKGIVYTKPKIIAGSWQTEVGSVGDIRETSKSKIGAYWLGKQEFGEKVEQKKYKKSSLRSQLLTRFIGPKMKAKQVKNVSSSIIQAPFNNRMGLAIGIKRAKRSGIRYVGSKWGVYEVLAGKFTPGKRNAVKIYSFSKKVIRLPKREWLKPATVIIMKNYARYARAEIDRAFKKFSTL
jgi:hypothetical protein